MSNQIIDKALKYLGEKVPIIGAYYTAEWSATTSSASGTVLCQSPIALPAGTYVVSVVGPVCSENVITTLKRSGNMFSPARYHFVGTATGFTEIIQLTESGYLQLTAEQSSTVTFSQLTRGYMRALRVNTYS